MFRKFILLFSLLSIVSCASKKTDKEDQKKSFRSPAVEAFYLRHPRH